jgi:hypothetical protein
MARTQLQALQSRRVVRMGLSATRPLRPLLGHGDRG